MAAVWPLVNCEEPGAEGWLDPATGVPKLPALEAALAVGAVTGMQSSSWPQALSINELASKAEAASPAAPFILVKDDLPRDKRDFSA